MCYIKTFVFEKRKKLQQKSRTFYSELFYYFIVLEVIGKTNNEISRKFLG